MNNEQSFVSFTSFDGMHSCSRRVVPSLGLNNVIREIVNTLFQSYGIKGKCWGIQGGYNGFYDFQHYRPVELTPELVANIHHEGGTVLGSSRGGFDLDKILSFLKSNKISCVFVIGGDGTHRGAFRKFCGYV